MKTIDLSDLKAGDKAWVSTYGKCFIDAIMNDNHVYPIAVVDSDGDLVGRYTINGLLAKYDEHPILFHSEQEFREYWGMESNHLTKREQFAMAAMQGLLVPALSFSAVAELAVNAADALLTKLNEKNPSK